MNIKINENELKKELAYLDTNDLIYSMKRNIDYLECHNKNYTKEQYYKILELQSFIRYMEASND